MKKPVHKRRKGYDSGGAVDDVATQILSKTTMPQRVERAQGGNLTPAQSERYTAAMKAMGGEMENASETAGRGRLGEYRNRTDAANYPAFKKGGKVKKVLRKR